jgi:hypothetical protein
MQSEPSAAPTSATAGATAPVIATTEPAPSAEEAPVPAHNPVTLELRLEASDDNARSSLDQEDSEVITGVRDVAPSPPALPSHGLEDVSIRVAQTPPRAVHHGTSIASEGAVNGSTISLRGWRMEPTDFNAMVREPSPKDSTALRKFYERQNEQITGLVDSHDVATGSGVQDDESACSSLSCRCTALAFSSVLY